MIFSEKEIDAADSVDETDPSKVPPMNPKRLEALINHFIFTTSSFLNQFATQCEERFLSLERKMQRVEAELIILEAKLASIPDKTESKEKDEHQSSSAEQSTEAQAAAAAEAAQREELAADQALAATVDKGIKASEDARYQKFFKMLRLGVPAQAVKLKMQTEGLLPDILDTPDLILLDGSTI